MVDRQMDSVNFVQGVTQRCEKYLGTGATYHNKKKYLYERVSGNI
jgi:hypothetical protein